VHSSRFAAVVRARRGGSLTELTHFDAGVNLANTLTRRRESYHRIVKPAPTHAPASDGGGMPSIHEIEEGIRMESLPPVDLDVRALFVDRVLPGGLEEAEYRVADYAPVHSWSRERFDAELAGGPERLTLALEASGAHRLSKTYEISEDGSVTVAYRWDPAAFPTDAVFAPEISVEVDPGMGFEPAPVEVWRHPIVTVSKREDGLEESVQGESVTPRWPGRLGAARILVPPPR